MSHWYVFPAYLNLADSSHASPALQKTYAPGSPERAALQAAITQMEQELPFEVPIIINGEPVRVAPQHVLHVQLHRH
jgi:hypothetical protein